MSASSHNVADLLWQSPGKNIEILSMTVREAISELYLIHCVIKSPEVALSFQDMLNKKAEVKLMCGTELEDERVFTGIITRFRQMRTRHGNLSTAKVQSYQYEVEIRPKLWLLTRQHNSKIFQEKTVRDIVSEVLDDAGLEYNWFISGSPRQREYCVQYEESDYAFISRLLEEEGICFYFDHEKQAVMFSDNSGGHFPCQPISEARYEEEVSLQFASGRREFVSDFSYEEHLCTGKFTLDHYNYEISKTNIQVGSDEAEIPCTNRFEHYEHTQNYKNDGEGQPLTDIRKEETIAWAKVGEGIATNRSFEAGYTITLSDHFRDDLNGDWLLESVQMYLEQGSCQTNFTALPVSVPFRPRRKTPIPKVTGVQTAEVTGPPGAKVYLDELGRCKLQFNWDREGEKNDRSSMWVRVSNGYAGKNYGIQWIPRIGNEVLVTFINGNPDLPVVTGRVYNDFNTPPLGPPELFENILKTIKDNHILFSDEDSKELVQLRAQKDMKNLVVNNRQTQIGNDEHINIKKNKKQLVEEEYHLHVGTDRKEKVDGDYSLEISGNKHMKTGSLFAIDTEQELHLKSGMKMINESGTSITLKAGGSFIQIDPSGVTIKGPIVKINSGGSAKSGSGIQLSSPEDPPELSLSGDPG
ncbi:MAG: hypothetical protein CR997_11030 [Acidobacteria bacterium]|nr:MAG: hypothetical protein CR997_11030 [Acidobacteriota bacterium]